MSETLKPCPFPSCGSTDVELSSYTEMRMVVGEEPTHRFQAVCRACGARGPRIASHDGGSAERDAIATWNRRSLPTGTAAPAEPRGDAGSLPSQRLPAEPEPDPTVFAVGYSTYAVDEVHALYKTRELAQAERDRLGGMWEVYEWTVNSTPDNP